ncbi:MAG: hydantoinase/oxoprolinase family protein [Gammaproteobacteria bacterium]
MSYQGHQVRVGADIGGTFTDVVLEAGPSQYSAKVLTNYSEPEQAIVEGLVKVAENSGIGMDRVDQVIHGTTLATNALIERRGADTAFITTQGFRDVIEMRTEGRFEQYDLNLSLPPPLISREHRYVVAGRIAANGRELVALDESAVECIAQTIRASGYQSVAIGFIHSYMNGEHEQRAREIINRLAPGVSVSISSEVSPQMREFERFNTVCANAFVKPLMASYLERLVERLKSVGADCPVFMIHSGGGLFSIDSAIEFPVRLLESGPAGGAIYAADIAARHGLNRVLSFDMGGTTAKICLIEQHTPKTARSFEVARTYRFKKGSGMPISIPVIEMVEIGAGGGSIGWVDALRQIRVGPESAGSEPGPACYDRGGKNPAVTDADLLLGRLDADNFAGGDIGLVVDHAVKALDRDIGKKLDMDAETAAIGICEVVDENMANAARVHAVESGKELGGFTMIAFGGAAPLHASRLCEKLGIDAMLVPPGAGVGSAIGFLRAPFGFEAVRGAYLKLSQFDPDWTNGLIRELSDEAEKFTRAGAPEGELIREIKAYMRYQGQGWEIVVVLPNRDFAAGDALEIRRLFEAEYIRLFGRALEGLDIEIMNWSVQCSSTLPAVEPVVPVSSESSLAPDSKRRIFDAREQTFVEARVYPRASMVTGTKVSGPAIIVENETTTIVNGAFEAVMQSDLCLLVRRKLMEAKDAD